MQEFIIKNIKMQRHSRTVQQNGQEMLENRVSFHNFLARSHSESHIERILVQFFQQHHEKSLHLHQKIPSVA
jgi:hypothetical protein